MSASFRSITIKLNLQFKQQSPLPQCVNLHQRWASGAHPGITDVPGELDITQLHELGASSAVKTVTATGAEPRSSTVATVAQIFLCSFDLKGQLAPPLRGKVYALRNRPQEALTCMRVLYKKNLGDSTLPQVLFVYSEHQQCLQKTGVFDPPVLKLHLKKIYIVFVSFRKRLDAARADLMAAA